MDLIFTSSEYLANSGCIDVNISNHLATFVTRKKHCNKANKKRYEGWTDFYESVDPNACWEIMIGNILTYVETQCPSRMPSV